MTLTARDPRAPFVLTPGARPLARRGPGFDWVLAGAALARARVGAVRGWAATRDAQRAMGADPQAYLYRHLVNVGIAAALMLAASRLDARLLRLFGPVVYLASIAGLTLVFGIGTSVNGARAWIRLPGGLEVQPSEFAKLGLVVGLAVLFAQRADERGWRAAWGAPRVRGRIGARRDAHAPTSGDMLLALALIGLPLALILLQPDLGSAMVLAAAAFGVLVAAGVRARWTLGLIALAVLVALVVVRAGLLADYQLQRFAAFTRPGHDPLGASYNTMQAHIAIAGGGLFGTGLFHGPQTNGGFVPEQQTDFVFSVAGEEFGLLGGAVIIALFAVLCWRGLVIARDAASADRAGCLLAAGVVCWFAFQAFQNIGMNLGLMPVTGLPLPFVSYGGSSMFAQALAIGLLQAVRRRSRG
jgi:rod shape determining protein RodA